MGTELQNGACVSICGIEYRVAWHEGLVVFSEQGGFYGVHTRLVFEHPKHALWQFSFSATWDKLPVAHIIKAYELVTAAFGGDHDQADKETEL